METIQFDDIAALQKHISEDFGEFGGQFEVTQEVINKSKQNQNNYNNVNNNNSNST